MLRDCALVFLGVCIALQVQALVQGRKKARAKDEGQPLTPRPTATGSLRRASSASEIAGLPPPHVLPHSHSVVWESSSELTYLDKDERSSGMLVLMRHGQSVWNRKPDRPDDVWRYAGTVDIPLSDVGIHEALEAGQALQHIPFDVVFCSQMDRARATVSLALSIHDSGKTPVVVHNSPLAPPEFADLVQPDPTRFVVPVYVTAALNERHFGSLQGVPSTHHPPGLAPIRNDYRLKFPGLKGESCADVEARALPFFRECIVPHLAAGKNVLVSTHGFVIRTLIKVLEDMDDDVYVSQMALEKSEPANCRLLAPTGVPLLYQYTAGGRFEPVAAENRRARARSIARASSSSLSVSS
ncbi:Aste57867_17455 [Aphanomyces stellatus]|uniref:phosphoglycerate mutase (2,3-diphosphoglycerate-dependent) n=1 Tax=Aphanomyces stellatus TaxID=120398 RepID=A0A485L8P5_9STRA|nr:hypothetical protein As57867_017395 [Aphanomyces stellatus]VFT94209.1 Aste57867_17455 [Aphanomyces stellatus]